MAIDATHYFWRGTLVRLRHLTEELALQVDECAPGLRQSFDGSANVAINVGATNILAAASQLARVEQSGPYVSQLCTFDMPLFGLRWMYVQKPVAQVLENLQRGPMTAVQGITRHGVDVRSQVAQLRWAGIPIAVERRREGGMRYTQWRIQCPVRVGHGAFDNKAKPMSQIWPSREAMELLRAEFNDRVLERKNKTMAAELDAVAEHEFHSEPNAKPDPQGSFDL